MPSLLLLNYFPVGGYEGQSWKILGAFCGLVSWSISRKKKKTNPFWLRDTIHHQIRVLPGGSTGKESACDAGDPGWEDSLEKGMATHSSILPWRIPWTEEPGRLHSMGSYSRA